MDQGEPAVLREVERWLEERSSEASDWPVERLLAAKHAGARPVTVSVVLPALDEETTVGAIVDAIRRDLMEAAPLVDELLVVDSGSTDRTAENAAAAGAKVLHRDEILPVLGVSKDKQIALELPPSADNTKPLGCSDTFITVEAKDPTANNEPALVTCSFDKGCQVPENHAFFRPWADKHDRVIAITSWTKGVIAAQTMQNSKQWTYLISESGTFGQKYDDQRVVMDGKSERGRLEIGALIGFGDRTVMMVSADVTGTTNRAWFLMASDDGGQTWAPP